MRMPRQPPKVDKLAIAADAARSLFADNVRAQRGARTQESIEARGGPEQSRLSRIERGETRLVNFEALINLCVALDCMPSQLFDGLDHVVVAAGELAST